MFGHVFIMQSMSPATHGTNPAGCNGLQVLWPQGRRSPEGAVRGLAECWLLRNSKHLPRARCWWGWAEELRPLPVSGRRVHRLLEWVQQWWAERGSWDRTLPRQWGAGASSFLCHPVTYSSYFQPVQHRGCELFPLFGSSSVTAGCVPSVAGG